MKRVVRFLCAFYCMTMLLSCNVLFVKADVLDGYNDLPLKVKQYFTSLEPYVGESYSPSDADKEEAAKIKELAGTSYATSPVILDTAIKQGGYGQTMVTKILDSGPDIYVKAYNCRGGGGYCYDNQIGASAMAGDSDLTSYYYKLFYLDQIKKSAVRWKNNCESGAVWDESKYSFDWELIDPFYAIYTEYTSCGSAYNSGQKYSTNQVVYVAHYKVAKLGSMSQGGSIGTNKL